MYQDKMNTKTKNLLFLKTILILSFILIPIQEIFAQYVSIYDVNPYIKFWVTTDPSKDDFPTVLDVKDTPVVEAINNLASTTQNLYLETLRNNYWVMANEETRTEQEQGIAKYKALALSNLIEQRILDWIKRGFNTKDGGNTGNPAFIEDEESFYRLIEKTEKENFKKTLERYYTYTEPGEEKNYFEKIQRITTTNSNNALKEDDYYLDEEEWSGEETFEWDEWLNSRSGQKNNPMVAYLTAQNNIDDLIKGKKSLYQAEIENNKGFLSYKKCTIKYFSVVTGEETENPSDSFYGDPYYEKDIWSYTSSDEYPVVSCTVMIPGYIISEQVSKIYNSVLDLTKNSIYFNNGQDLVLDSINEPLLNLMRSTYIEGILGDISYKELNEAIYKASDELSKRDGGNTNISQDRGDPRNESSRFNPKNFLTDENWEEIWNQEENNNNWFNWIDYLFEWKEITKITDKEES